jgi:hypothetical protein
MQKYIKKEIASQTGDAVAQWLKLCATNRKFAGSLPAEAVGFFLGKIHSTQYDTTQTTNEGPLAQRYKRFNKKKIPNGVGFFH